MLDQCDEGKDLLCQSGPLVSFAGHIASGGTNRARDSGPKPCICTFCSLGAVALASMLERKGRQEDEERLCRFCFEGDEARGRFIVQNRIKQTFLARDRWMN